MNETLVLAIPIVAFWLLVSYWRIPAAVFLLSILVGKLFAEELSPDFYSFLTGLLSFVNPLYVQLGLLLLPVVLTTIFLKDSLPKSRLVINALPLVLCVVSLGLFINPYIQVVNGLDEAHRALLTNNQGYIVSLTAGLTLLTAWLPHLKHHEKSKKHSKK